MFKALTPEPSRSRFTLLGTSLAAHFLFLAWMLHSAPAVFVSPSAVARGDEGKHATLIYLGGKSGITQSNPVSRLVLPRPNNRAQRHTLPPLPPKMQAGNELTAPARSDEPAQGSLFGSLSSANAIGQEVRPALPVQSPDPTLGGDGAQVAGDVIIEVTIDEAGTIVRAVITQGVAPAVDQRVLAAVQRWHFLPATRDGTPVASKQDVYYHFPR